MRRIWMVAACVAALSWNGAAQETAQPASSAKGTTLIGCLAGPDADDLYTLTSMQHRLGVAVVGGEELKQGAGSKVKLTGQWQPAQSPAQDKNTTAMRRFQVTDVEVVAQTCHPPSVTTPVSKEKRGKTTTYDAPSADSGK